MSDKGKTIHLRLSAKQQRKMELLHQGHFGGLPFSSVVKLLLVAQLRKDHDDLVEIIQREIATPTEEAHQPRSQSRLPSTNTSKPKSRR